MSSPLSRDTIYIFLLASFARHLLHRCDRGMIYLFIAGSYTPWLVLKQFDPADGAAAALRDGIWGLALAGIAYQQVKKCL